MASVTFGKQGNYQVEAVVGPGGSVLLRVLAPRTGQPQLVATVLLSSDEAHELGWKLRGAAMERRWDVYEESH